MKANEVPERLYLNKLIYGTFLYQSPDPDDKTEVEYTRTDIFIEKACEYLEPIIFSMNSGDQSDTDKFIENFKNYMKGE